MEQISSYVTGLPILSCVSDNHRGFENSSPLANFVDLNLLPPELAIEVSV